MITELLKVDPQIVGGSKIRVVDHNIRNFRLHQTLEQMSRLMLFCLECDSNNTSAQVLPSDSRKIRQQWEIVKSELQFSFDHNDFPQAEYEQTYTMCVIDQKEIQKIRNVKMKRVTSEIWNTVNVILGCDSANTQGFISSVDYDAIVQSMSLAEDTMIRWIGAGRDATDCGVVAPAYEILGELRPDVDSDWAQTLEPSSGLPYPNLPDAPDTEPTADPVGPVRVAAKK
jgi:hypothetical protein